MVVQVCEMQLLASGVRQLFWWNAGSGQHIASELPSGTITQVITR